MKKSPYPPLKLLMPVIEATQKINERISKGKELREIPIGNEHALERARKEYYKWSDYNHELMRRMFTSEEIADEFSGFGFAVGRSEMTFREEIENFGSLIDTKIYRLESIRDRLELIPVDDSIAVEAIVSKKLRRVKFPINPQSSKKQIQFSETWDDIRNDFDISKRTFGRKIKFVTNQYKREVIFRDIEQAYILSKNSFYKPAVILAGSVIEELLRLYLENKNVKPSKNTFEEYVKACENNGLLKSAISRLSDSVRYFRNLVHLEKEKSQKYAISKATANGAVSSIFIIANDFDT